MQSPLGPCSCPSQGVTVEHWSCTVRCPQRFPTAAMLQLNGLPITLLYDCSLTSDSHAKALSSRARVKPVGFQPHPHMPQPSPKILWASVMSPGHLMQTGPPDSRELYQQSCLVKPNKRFCYTLQKGLALSIRQLHSNDSFLSKDLLLNCLLSPPTE